jgi:hypothetical protein
MSRQKRDVQELETCLFDLLPPSAALPTAQIRVLTELVALLLREIAVALENREVGDDQDHA